MALDLVSAFAPARGAKQVAHSSSVQSAAGDDPIIDDDPSVPTVNRDAVERTVADKLRKPIPGRATGRAVQFRRIEIGQPNFDPGRRIGRASDAQTVPIADITDHAREDLSRTRGQPAFAGICVSDGGDKEKSGEDQKPFHGREGGPIRPAREAPSVRWRERECGGGRSDLGAADQGPPP